MLRCVAGSVNEGVSKFHIPLVVLPPFGSYTVVGCAAGPVNKSHIPLTMLPWLRA